MRITPSCLHKAFIRTACFLMLSVPAAADQGQQLYSTCAACHGGQGQGNPALQAPALAGLDSDYIQRQLELFQAGSRGSKPGDTAGAQMRAAAGVLTSADQIAAVSDFISELSPTTADVTVEGNIRNGTNHYQATCGTCHGSQGQGNKALKAPALAGQDGEYLRRQYLNFRKGLRGYDANDRPGRQMAMMANGLNDEQLNDVIAFIGQLQPTTEPVEH
ncbi:c-type cytochrome [Maricurvus nonylphenolicus]|uniref:c-type cytochrome n=1 Tax=Maricurvus nonylphenolicus TaxID=1008307 RepID=UPI0036F4072B